MRRCRCRRRTSLRRVPPCRVPAAKHLTTKPRVTQGGMGGLTKLAEEGHTRPPASAASAWMLMLRSDADFTGKRRLNETGPNTQLQAIGGHTSQGRPTGKLPVPSSCNRVLQGTTSIGSHPTRPPVSMPKPSSDAPAPIGGCEWRTARPHTRLECVSKLQTTPPLTS